MKKKTEIPDTAKPRLSDVRLTEAPCYAEHRSRGNSDNMNGVLPPCGVVCGFYTQFPT